MKYPLSHHMGKTFAHIQDLFDTLIQIGIHRVKEIGGSSNTSKEGRVFGLRKILKFFSELGDSFYDTYSDIKSKKSSSDNIKDRSKDD